MTMERIPAEGTDKAAAAIAFISYAHEDSGFVEHEVIPVCTRCGFTAWRDRDIRAGEDFERRITEELRRADIFLLVMTPGSQASQWVRDELHAALYLGKTVIPLMHQDCDPLAFHIRLSGLQLVEARQSAEPLARALDPAHRAALAPAEPALRDRTTAFAAVAITLLPLAEVHHLRNLTRGATAAYRGGRPVRHELRHLCDLGLCRRKPERSVGDDLADGRVVDLAEIIELTDVGRALSAYVR